MRLALRVGCQTNAWAIDPSRPETLFDSLQAIHELEFQGFETGFRNILPLRDQAIKFPDLTFFGVHIFLPEYDSRTWLAPLPLVLEVAAAAGKLGAERLILSGAPASGENAQVKAAALNEIATCIRPIGLTLAYHNHGPEVQGPAPEIETLLSGTDPTLVSLLLDAGHAFRAGVDIPSFITRHAERLTGVHLRDFKQSVRVPLGQGDFPLADVARALEEANWSGWILAEEEREDGSKLGLSAAGPARQALQRAFEV